MDLGLDQTRRIVGGLLWLWPLLALLLFAFIGLFRLLLRSLGFWLFIILRFLVS